MIKRSFFGCMTPKLKYEVVDEKYTEPTAVRPKREITLFFPPPDEESGAMELKVGDSVQCAQKLLLTGNAKTYALSSRSGQISDISKFVGIFDKQSIAVTIDIDEKSSQTVDEGFKNTYQTPSLKNAADFLEGLPGNPGFEAFFDKDNPVQTIAILGIDKDLFSMTNQYIVKSGIASIKTGIEILRQITGVHNVILVVPPYLAQVASSAGATVKTVDVEYPSAHPTLIKRYLLSQIADHKDSGLSENCVTLFTAEAVSAIGAAYNTGRIPLEKMVTFVSKDGTKRLISVTIGTPLQDVLDAFEEKLDDGDRLIVGGPLTGIAVYSADYPVLSDMDTFIIQGVAQIPGPVDIPCINCGECVRVCPIKIPVNMLVRYLEAGQYETAQDQYALGACIECGFCAYVCESRIPILQHIKLAKHTLKKMNAAEEMNA